MKKVTAASIALALMAGTSAVAQTVQYDTTIAKAAAKKAAEKIGDMRGSIDYNQVPDLVTRDDLIDKPSQTSFLPQEEKNALPPISKIIPNVDMTVTGSIQSSAPSVLVWDRFDKYGNPIK